MRGYGTLENVQSWWEVPCIAHFCSLFRLYFELLDFDIEELEEALITDGAEDSDSLLQELILRLLRGCFDADNDEITSSNYQMYLRRLFRIKCEEDPSKNNPFEDDLAFHSLPLRTKVEILKDLCDFRLDNVDVPESLKALEAESLRVDPLGEDSGGSTYWYFYGTRLYREDYATHIPIQSARKRGRKGKDSQKKLKLGSEQHVQVKWTVACVHMQDWQVLTAKFKDCKSSNERNLHKILRDDFLPALPRLYAEKERLQRNRMLESPLRRSGRFSDEDNSYTNCAHALSVGVNAFLNGVESVYISLIGGKPRNSRTLCLPILNPNLLRKRLGANANLNGKSASSGERTVKHKRIAGYDNVNWSDLEEDDDNNNYSRKIVGMDLDEDHSREQSSSPPEDEEEVRRRREEQEKADRLFAESIEREERKARLHLRERRGCGTTFSSPSNAGSRNSSSVSTERPQSVTKASTVSKQTIAAAISKKNSKASPVKASPVKKKGKSSSGKSRKNEKKRKGNGGRMTNNSLSVSLSSVEDEDEEQEEKSGRESPIPEYTDEDEDVDEEDDNGEFKKSSTFKRLEGKDKKKKGLVVSSKKKKKKKVSSSRSPSPSGKSPSGALKKKTKKSPKRSMAKKKKREGDGDDDEDGGMEEEEEENLGTVDEDEEFCEEEEEADYESIVARTLHASNAKTKLKKGEKKGRSSSMSPPKEKGKKGSKEKKRKSEGLEERSKSHDKKKEKDKAGKKKKEKSSGVGKSKIKELGLASALMGSSSIMLGGGTSKTKVKGSVLFSQSEEDVQIGMHKVIEAIKNHRDAWPFVNPVDEDYAPNYYKIIDHPMDLQTMEDKLDNQEYSSLDEFKADFDRIVQNCRTYNGPGSEYTEMVETVEGAFNKLIQRYIIPDESDEEISIEYTNAVSERKRPSISHSIPLGSESPSKKKTKKDSESSNEKKKSGGSTSPPAPASKKEHKKENEPSSDSLPPKKKPKLGPSEPSKTPPGAQPPKSPKKSLSSTTGPSTKELKEREKMERKKKKAQLMRHHSRDSEAIENLATVAAETLKDINKWLDDTPNPSADKSASESGGKKESKGDEKAGGASSSTSGGVKEKKKKLLSSSGGQKRKLELSSSKKARSTQFIMDEDDEYNIDRDLSPPPPKKVGKAGEGSSKEGKSSKSPGEKIKDGKEKGKKDKHHHHHHHKHHHHHHHHSHHKKGEEGAATSLAKSVSKVLGKKSTFSSSSSVSSLSTSNSGSASQTADKAKGKGKKKEGSTSSSTGAKKKVKKKGSGGNGSSAGSFLNTLKNSPAFKRMTQMSRASSKSSPVGTGSQEKSQTATGSVQGTSAGSGTSQGQSIAAFDALLSNLGGSGGSGTGGGDNAAITATNEKKKCLLVNDLPEDKEGGPKLSLGSVLSTDAIKLGNIKDEVEEGLSDDDEFLAKIKSKGKIEEVKVDGKKEEEEEGENADNEKEEEEVNRKLEPSKGFNREKCMPNLSAWIKAFGGPVKNGSGGGNGSNSGSGTPSGVSATSPQVSPVKKVDPESKNKFRVMGRGVGESDGSTKTNHNSGKAVGSHHPHLHSPSGTTPLHLPHHHHTVIKMASVVSPSSGSSTPSLPVGPSWNPVTSPHRPSPPINPLLNPIKQAALERTPVGEDLTSPSSPTTHHHHHSSKKHRNRKMSSSSLSSQSESGSPLCVTSTSSQREGSSTGVGGGSFPSVVNPPRWVEDHPWGPVSQSQSPSASSHVSSQSPAGPNSPFSPSVSSPPPGTPQTPPRPPAPVRVGFYQDITASQHSSPDKVNESQSSPATPPTPNSASSGGGGRGNAGGDSSSFSSSRRHVRDSPSSTAASSQLYPPRYSASSALPGGPGSNQSATSLPSPSTPPSGGHSESLSNPNSPNSPKVVNMSSGSSSSVGPADYRSPSVSSNGPQPLAHQQSRSTPLHTTLSPYSTPPAHHHSPGSHPLVPEAAHSHHHHHQTPAHAHSNSSTPQISHVHSIGHLGQPQQAHAGSNQYDGGSGRYPPNLPHAHQQPPSVSPSVAVSSTSASSSSSSSSYSGSGGSVHPNLAQAHAHSRQSTSQPHLSHPYPSNPYTSNPRSINVAPNVYNNPISSDSSMNRYYKAAIAAVASAGGSGAGSELTLSMGPSSTSSSASPSAGGSGSSSSSSSKRNSRSNASANATPSPHPDIPRSASVTPTAAAAVAAALEAGKLAPSDLANGFHWPHNLASLTQIVNSIPGAYRHYAAAASADPENMTKYQRAAVAAAAAAESNAYPVTTSAGSGGAPTPSGTKSSHHHHHHHHHHHQSEKGVENPTPAHQQHHHHHHSHSEGTLSASSSSKKQSKSSSEAKSRSQTNASAKSTPTSSSSTSSSATSSGGGIVPGSAFNFSSLATPDSLALYSKEMSDAATSSLYSASPPTLTPPMAHRASDFYPTASSASHFPHHSSFSAAAGRSSSGGVPTPPITPYPFLPGTHPSPYQAHQPVSSQPFAAHSQSSRGLDPYQQLFQGSPHVMGLLSHPSGYPAPYAHPHSSLGFNRPGWI